MKTKWVYIDDDEALDFVLEEDEIAAQEYLQEITNELEDPHYPSGTVPVDTQLNLEFTKMWNHKFLDYFLDSDIA